MKKVFALVLTIALIATITVASFAADFNTSAGTDTKNLTATYLSGASDEAVYSVNVAWPNMTLEYDAGTKTWNPDRMDYVADDNGDWVEGKDSLTITVSNASNKAVSATMSVSNKADTGVTVSVDGNATKTLASAVGETEAVADTFTLSVSGTPNIAKISANTLATATVLFSKVSE